MSRILHLSRWGVALLALVVSGLVTPGMVCVDSADCAMAGMMDGCSATALAPDHCDGEPVSVTADCCRASSSAASAVAVDGTSVPGPSDLALPAPGRGAATAGVTWSGARQAALPDGGARPAGRTLLALHQTFLS